MSTERLTDEDILNKHDDRIMVFYSKALSAMQEYADQEVEYKTKQLQEERDRAVELIVRLHKVLNKSEFAIYPGSPFSKWIEDFLK